MTEEFKNGDKIQMLLAGNWVSAIYIGPMPGRGHVCSTATDCIWIRRDDQVRFPKKERWINILHSIAAKDGVEFPQSDLFESEAEAIASAATLYGYRRVATKKIEY